MQLSSFHNSLSKTNANQKKVKKITHKLHLKALTWHLRSIKTKTANKCKHTQLYINHNQINNKSCLTNTTQLQLYSLLTPPREI